MGKTNKCIRKVVIDYKCYWKVQEDCSHYEPIGNGYITCGYADGHKNCKNAAAQIEVNKKEYDKKYYEKGNLRKGFNMILVY